MIIWNTNASGLYVMSERNMAYQHHREEEMSVAACLSVRTPPDQRALSWNRMRWRVRREAVSLCVAFPAKPDPPVRPTPELPPPPART